MSIRLPRYGMVNQSNHAVVEAPDVPRSRFVTRTTRKQTQNAADLAPFFWDEVAPGDSLRYDITAMVRMSTPIAPMFSNVSCDVFLFFIPDRIVWTNFERFMGEQTSPSDDISALLVPSVTFTQAQLATQVGSIADYLGLPIGQLDAGGQLLVSALTFRAYFLTYDEWFRDQNLIAKQSPVFGDGPDSPTWYNVQCFKRAKSHDYFAAALPWTQKFTAPTVPLAGNAPVKGIGFDIAVAGATGTEDVRETSNPVVQQYANWRTTSTAGAIHVKATGSGANAQPEVFADLSAVSGVSINQLRQAVQVQRLLERDARGGTRYVESVFSHWRVRPQDYRTDRPEYIGGGRGMVELTPVAQTSQTGTTPLGNVGAAGTGVIRARGSYAALEHGRVLGIISMRAEQAYQQGLGPKWFRRARLDYPFPALMQLGEQAVLRREIYVRGTADDTTQVFGYVPRYEEFRTHYSDVAGRFRSTAPTPLDMWHLAERFVSAPVLGQTFIEADQTTFDRVLTLGATARTLHQQFLCDILIERDFTRAFPMFGTPVGLGRF